MVILVGGRIVHLLDVVFVHRFRSYLSLLKPPLDSA